MANSQMADALSALSLLLTAFTVLFSLWQPIAKAALAITPMPQRKSRNDQIEQVVSASWRMTALLAVSLIVSGIFAPRAACIAFDAVATGGKYNDMRTAFVIAELLLVGLFLLVLMTVLQLRALLTKLKSSGIIDP